MDLDVKEAEVWRENTRNYADTWKAESHHLAPATSLLHAIETVIYMHLPVRSTNSESCAKIIRWWWWWWWYGRWRGGSGGGSKRQIWMMRCTDPLRSYCHEPGGELVTWLGSGVGGAVVLLQHLGQQRTPDQWLQLFFATLYQPKDVDTRLQDRGLCYGAGRGLRSMHFEGKFKKKYLDGSCCVLSKIIKFDHYLSCTFLSLLAHIFIQKDFDQFRANRLAQGTNSKNLAFHL